MNIEPKNDGLYIDGKKFSLLDTRLATLTCKYEWGDMESGYDDIFKKHNLYLFRNEDGELYIMEEDYQTAIYHNSLEYNLKTLLLVEDFHNAYWWMKKWYKYNTAHPDVKTKLSTSIHYIDENGKWVNLLSKEREDKEDVYILPEMPTEETIGNATADHKAAADCSGSTDNGMIITLYTGNPDDHDDLRWYAYNQPKLVNIPTA